MSDRAALRAAQLVAVLDALTAEPGLTAYQVGAHVPVHLASTDCEPIPALGRPGPLTLTLNLLAELEKAGKAAHVDDPHGNRWYPTGTPAGAEHRGELT